MKKKNVKQLLSALLVIAMMATLLVVPAAAADAKIEVDVWDFGAEQLADTDQYHFINHLNVEEINGWYPEGTTAGASGVSFPAGVTQMAGGLCWDTAGAANHRLRTDNTALTRDSGDTSTGDGKDPYIPADAEGNPETYSGLLYSNSSAKPEVYMGLECESGDIVTFIVASNGTDSLLNFTGPSGEVEGSFIFTRGSRTKAQTVTFYARDKGLYKLNSINEKLVVDRVYRQHATPVPVSGTVTEAAGMPAGYALVFTNTTTGAQVTASVSGGKYTATLPAPYTYEVSLQNASGFAVLDGADLTVLAEDAAGYTHDVSIQAVDRVKVSGAITGLDEAALAKMGQNLLFTPTGDGVVYNTEVRVNVTASGASYEALVEKGMPNTISALYVNDYEITTANVTDRAFTANTTLDLTFAKKTTYPVTLTPDGIDSLEGATVTCTKLDEAGETEDQTLVPFNPYSASNLQGNIYNYAYTFTYGTDTVALRDGVYDVAVTTPKGAQRPTANLTVKGAAASLTVPFTPAAAYVAPGTYNFSGTANGTLPAIDGMSFAGFTGHGDSHGLNTTGAAPYTITLALESLSNVTIAGCQYSAKDGDTVALPTATADGEAVEVVSDGATDPTYTISGVSGTLVITFTDKGASYVHSIAVENAVKVFPTEWDFGTWASNSGGKQGDPVPADVLNGITVTGQVKSHATDYGIFIKGGKLDIPVSGPCTVTVSVGNSYDIKFPGDTEAKVATGSVPKKTTFSYDYEGEEGTVTVEFGSGATTYIDKITVEYPEVVYYGTNWDWRNDGVGQGTSYLKEGTATFADVDGVGTLTVSGTKFGGHNTQYGTEGNSYTMTVPVMTACTVKVMVGYHWWVWADGENVTSSFTEEAPATHNNIGENNEGDGGYVTFTYTGEGPGEVVIHTGSEGDSYIAQVLVEYADDVVLPVPPVTGDIVLKVGPDKNYKTINAALDAAAEITRDATQRITIEIDPGNYEEQIYVKTKNITFKNAAADKATLELKNKGVDIGDNEVRITWYYGHGYTYYSMTDGHRYNADVLKANQANGYASYKNAGSGTTDDSYWNASVLIAADGFQAEGIIFENSFNQYVSAASVQDTIEAQGSQAKEGNVPRAEMKTPGDTKVQEKAYVERAGAVSIKSGSKIFFDHCAFVGRQDVLYGPEGSTVALYDCDVYGGTDYIYGPMTLVAAKCDLVLNTSEDNNDVAYITAPQQASHPGYLMWNCTVTSTTPGVNTASQYRSKPGLFGRPWAANTGEALFYATNIEATDPIYVGTEVNKEIANTSLILPSGWTNTLNGESVKCAELGTVEYYEGVNNTDKRVNWAGTVEKAPTVADFLGTWDPFTENNKDMTIEVQEQESLPETFPVPVKTITINEKEQELEKGGKFTFTATVEPEGATDKTVYWTSSDVSVVTVDKTSGEVTAVDGGSAYIYAKSANAMVTASVRVTVIIPAESVTLSKDSVEIIRGRKTNLTATVNPDNATDKTVYWTSEDTNVVTVDGETGRITAVAVGETTVTAHTANGKTASCTVKVIEVPTVDPGQQPSFSEADKTDLAAAIQAAKDKVKDVKTSKDGSDVPDNEYWATAEDLQIFNEAIEGAQSVMDDANASQDLVNKTAAALRSLTEAFPLTLGSKHVDPTEPTLTVTPATKTLKVNETVELTASVTPAEAKETVYWTTEDTSVISLSASEGDKVTVTALAVGEATITAKAGDKTATAKITVTEEGGEEPDEISVTINTSKVTVKKTVKLSATVTPADAEYDHLYWVSDDTDVLTVDNTDGTATGVKAGKATVHVYVLDDKGNTLAEAEKEITVSNVSVNYGGGGSTTGQTTTPATTKTNSNGDTVKTETKSNGDKTVTVTDKDGNVLVTLQIPAQTPDLGYKFTDVPDDHWAEPSIQAMAAMKVFQGVSATGHIFDMNSAVTRGTMAQILFNLSQGKAGVNNPFTDSQGNWYSDAVAWAASVGVVTGVSDTNFAPNDSITREQLITMLYRYAQLLALDTNVTADMGKFVDADEIDSWASAAMTWAVGKGLIIGKGAGNLDPKAAASRAEAAVIIDRFLQMV